MGMKSPRVQSGTPDPSVLHAHLISIIFVALAVSFSIGSTYGPLHDLGSLSSPPANDEWTFPSGIQPSLPVGGTDSDFAGSRRAFSLHTNGLGAFLDGSVEPPGPRPSGVHLVLDIRNVASSFLSDGDVLGRAMNDFAVDAGLTLMSWYCRAVPGGGSTCVGVLSDSHLSLQTWPVEGVLSFDLVTFCEELAMSTIPLVEKHFGVPRRAGEGRGIYYIDDEPTRVYKVWSRQLRGFRTEEEQNGVLNQESDLMTYILTPFDQKLKKEIISITTPHQRIDIWENLFEDTTPSYYDMLRGPYPLGDKRYTLTDDYVSSEKTVFLDGKGQGSTETDRVYYEVMVQPAMFAHSNPRRVAVVGGGSGAVIRELLKHKTIETIVMIEKDEVLVEIMRKYSKTQCSCINVEGAASVCFDDPRVETRYVDAVNFFTENFDIMGKKGDVEKFDVVFVGVLNPMDKDEPLYGKEFLDAVTGSLTQNGIITAQVGPAPTLLEPPDHRSMNIARDGFFRHLETRLETMLVYEESRAGWDDARSFLIGCASKACRNQWYAESDVVDAEIDKRTVKTVSVDADITDGDTTFVHFDGGTQRGYGLLPKAWENMYCRREPEPEECKYRQLDPDREIVNWEAGFEVRRDADSQAGVYATRDVRKGSYVMAEEHVTSIFVTADVYQNIANVTPPGALVKDFLEYTDKYGRESLTEGPGGRVMELGPSILTRKVREREGANVARISTFLPPLPTYSPVFERNRRMFDVLIVATRDIVKGEEVILHEG